MDKMNFCVIGLMSKCAAGTTWKDQEKCKFSEKATDASRCMHYIEAIDGHCDCQKAQCEMRHPELAEEEIDMDFEELIAEEPTNILETLKSCATCGGLESEYSVDCKLWPHLDDDDLTKLGQACPGYEITATCIICKHHDGCHDGTSGDNYHLLDKISIAQTCKKYDPITNNPAVADDDIPF